MADQQEDILTRGDVKDVEGEWLDAFSRFNGQLVSHRTVHLKCSRSFTCLCRLSFRLDGTVVEVQMKRVDLRHVWRMRWKL